MQFLHNYSIEAQLKSLSERLKHFCKHTESNHSFASNLKSENLKYNISLVAAHIILNLKFIDRSKNVFLNIIQEYNNKHKTSLAYEDFKKINWIRDVNDEILMPGGIKSFISQIGYYATEGKPIDIPADKVDISKCLQDYYNKCFDNAALTISNEKVEEILSKYAAPGLSAKYLQDSDILFYNTKTGLYNWKGSDCTRYLNNEIAATLWLLSCGENATRENFQQWFRLLIGAGIWVHDLSGYLSYDNTCKISEYAFDKLYIEPDLLKCDNEFAKTWLDGESYRHIDINTDIPVVKFDYSNTYNQVENIQYHKWRFHDAFDYQRIRSFCYLLVRLIINHDKEASYPYKEIIKLLKDTSRPFLTWTLFKEIPKDFAQVIPYLLTEPELIPLAFKQIDKTEIQTEFISKQTQQEQQFEDACNLKNEWWLEMFDFLLEQLNHSSKSTDEAGELIAKILFTTANDVFYLRNGHRNQLILHNAYRKRYDEALKKLANKKITNYNVYPTPPVNPNITLYLLPGMVDYLSNWYKKQPLQHTESISLTSGFLDVCIETLQLFHTKNENPSLNTELEDKLKTSESELIKTLTEYLQTYYSSTQIEVTTYYETGTEVRKVRRSSVEFGFEIINWGLLYLKLYNTDSLEKVENVFTKQLIIDINTHKYDDSNREQVEKIKVWLKSLLLAFINVHQKKQDFISKGLPAEKFLKDIENTIASLSIKFSSYKLSEGSINIFEETYNSFGYNQYHEHITTLLFRADRKSVV